MIELNNLRVSFGTHRALDAGTLTFTGSSVVALMGPNGSGKTTLLRVLAGLQSATAGTRSAPPEMSVAYVAQHQHQHQWMPLTVGEVLRMGRYRNTGLLGRLSRRDRSLIDAAAERVGVTDLTNASFGELSGGQRQRVLVAMALAGDADCFLLDEPITGLDPPSQRVILDIIDDERAGGRLVVFSTHHLDEARHGDRVLLLAGGRVIADGPPAVTLSETNLAETFGERLVSSQDPVMVLDEHGHGSHGHADHGHANHDAPGVTQ